MRLRPTVPLTAAVCCLLVAGLAIALVGGRFYARAVYRHVVVQPFNIKSEEQVFVNCEQAALFTPEDRGREVDLGWLDADDRVTMTATNMVGDAAWGFHATSNEEELFLRSRGEAYVKGFRAEPHALVMARTFTASRDPLGAVGCQPEGSADSELTDYRTSRDELDAPPAKKGESPFRRERTVLDTVDAWGGGAPLVAGIAGVVALFFTPRLRNSLGRQIGEYSPVQVGLALIGLASSLYALSRALGTGNLLLLIGLAGVLLLTLVALTLAAPNLREALDRYLETGSTDEAAATGESPRPSAPPR